MSWQSQMKKARERKPSETSVQVCVNDDAMEAYIVAEANVSEARKMARARVGYAIAREEIPQPKTPEDGDALIDADPAVVEAETARDAARAARDDATITFTFRALAPDAFDDLVASHAPRDGVKTDEPFGYNVSTFRPALVAACHVHYETGDDGTLVEQEGMTYDDAVDIFTSAGWSAADRDTLFATAWAVNQTSRVEYADLGKG